MDLATFLVQCLNAVQYGLLLFLVASGLTLIFGIMGVINLAHGSFYMIGAYMAYALAPFVAGTFGGGFFSTLAVGVVLSVVFGYVLEWAFYSYLYEREHLQQVLMTYGLILVFEEIRSLLVGDDVHGVQAPAFLAGAIPLGDVMTYPVYRLFISGVNHGERPLAPRLGFGNLCGALEYAALRTEAGPTLTGLQAQLVKAWKYRADSDEALTYYAVPTRVKWEYAAYYIGLAAFLAVMTHDVHEMLGAARHLGGSA